jgi:hypothetical protein
LIADTLQNNPDISNRHDFPTARDTFEDLLDLDLHDIKLAARLATSNRRLNDAALYASAESKLDAGVSPLCLHNHRSTPVTINTDS